MREVNDENYASLTREDCGICGLLWLVDATQKDNVPLAKKE